MARKPPKPEAAPQDAEPAHGVSPDKRTNLVLAAIALRGGELLLRRGVGKRILGLGVVPDKARDMVKGATLGEALVTTAITRLATKSVPGAILVGGGLLAKTLYDRRKARARREAEATDPGGSGT